MRWCEREYWENRVENIVNKYVDNDVGMWISRWVISTIIYLGIMFTQAPPQLLARQVYTC
jgi:hypothetical protein